MAMMTTNYRSCPMNHSTMMILMLSAQTTSQSLKMGHNQTIPALHPRMIGPSSLCLHPLLCVRLPASRHRFAFGFVGSARTRFEVSQMWNLRQRSVTRLGQRVPTSA